jgi:ribonucleoside-diphosphate reductase alpha chain
MSPNTTTVFEFPVKCKGAFSRNSLTAEQHLNLWLTYQRYWCEHKPSITVNVRDHEWLSVGDWVYRHFDEATGISFLPHFEGDHIYKQTPYSEIDEETYNRLNDAYKHATANLDWSRLSEYEKEDTTAGSQTLSCSGNSCAIVDLTDSEENT